ncbi:MAG: hypothetical protein QOE90_328 [Thermoplasmata archaeon]|nr:hypothetical protein [Thermoplasmata archaeon]
MDLPNAKRAQVLVGILFTVILAGLDNTIVGTIMPVARAELGSPGLYAWAFAAYMLATAISMPLWGPGSDRWGRKRTYLVGIAVFTLGSALCAAAPTMPLFIAARTLQGLGAGAVSSLPFIVLGVVFPPQMRGKALGVVSSAWAIASVAGPAMGSAVTSFTSWRWAFLINVPIALLAGALILLAMPESHGDREGRFDLAGALLAGVGGGLLVWAFVDMGEGTIGTTEYALALGGLALLALFVWVESRAAKPILPLDLFRHRGYAASMAASLLLFFTAFGISAYLPLRAHDVHGPGAVGWVVGVFTIGWSGCAFTAGRIVHRVGERSLGLVGVAVHVAGFLALALFFDRSLAAACLAAGVCGAGMGILSPGLTVVVQNSVEVRRMASATTSQQFVRQISAALGVSAFVLLAGLRGFVWSLYAFALVAAVALAFVALLPPHSLSAHGPAGAAPAGEP